jgi:extracellular elastinolytic metalloproteinase
MRRQINLQVAWKSLLLCLVVAGFDAVPFVSAQSAAGILNSQHARVYEGLRGVPLSAPSTKSPVSIAAQFLRQQGASASTAASLRAVAQYRSRVTGLTHLRLQQEVFGLSIYDAYVKAALNRRGELVHVIDNTAVVAGKLKAAQVSDRQALHAALAAIHPGLKESPAAVARQGNTTVFSRSAFFYAAPTVERVAVSTVRGLEAGFLVETWSAKGNLLHDTLVSGAGQVLNVQLRTNSDSYRVFPIDPVKTTQTVVPGPGSTTESPLGWLFAGAQKTINIAGNNAHSYLDAVSNNRPDTGGSSVTDGNFLTTADLGATPSTTGNSAVAVQNLFYLNNVIHDELYRHGFNEAAGNFQENNFANGGKGSDSVNAEAQDGGGIDNANFATPRDGQNPRMQMYLWTGKGGQYQVVVNSPITTTYGAQGAEFGASLDTTGVTGDVVLVDDGTGTTSDGCEAITNNIAGKIALIDRGSCNFTVKVHNAQSAGAISAIVTNNAGDDIIVMGGTDHQIKIAAVFIGQTDGAALRSLASPNVTDRFADPQPLKRDGDLDSDIVWHEYGHGLTWRMIGDMSGPLAGAIGEGMSDTLSVIMNEDDVVGEYAFDNTAGIRRFPYTNYPGTYSDIQGTEVHDDGELYGAIGWQMFLNYTNDAISKSELLDSIVDGMNFTPSQPTFEQMRDGILDSISNSAHPERDCLVWNAFAKYGVGVGAQGQVVGHGPNAAVVATDSFDVPVACQ